MDLALQTMTGYAASLELARWAESEGLAAFAVADHYVSSSHNPYALDQLSVMAAIATATNRIQLATLVSPITFRHPAVMLKTAVTIDEISGGRFMLGVGAGWMEAEHERFGLDFPSTPERFDRLTEALEYLRAALSDDERGFEGSYYRLAPGPAPQPIGTNLRLLVGGAGRLRTPDLAGTFAHEFNVSPSPVPYAPRINRARQAAAAAGRDPEQLLISTAFPIVVGADETEVGDRLATVAARRGVGVDDMKTRWAEAGIPMGTVDQYLSRLDELAAEGIQRVYFQVAFDPFEEICLMLGMLDAGTG